MTSYDVNTQPAHQDDQAEFPGVVTQPIAPGTTQNDFHLAIPDLKLKLGCFVADDAPVKCIRQRTWLGIISDFCCQHLACGCSPSGDRRDEVIQCLPPRDSNISCCRSFGRRLGRVP